MQGYYMGVVIGRVANRISDAHFKNADGQEIHLTPNDGKHALHGGVNGFQTKRFSAESVTGPGYKAAVLKYTSPAGEEVSGVVDAFCHNSVTLCLPVHAFTSVLVSLTVCLRGGHMLSKLYETEWG